jgi:hypothetical protein
MSLQEKKTTTTITTKLQRWGHSSPHSIDWHKKERDSERDSFYLLCMCVSVWVCVSLSLFLSVFQTLLSLSLSLPVCFCCLVLSLSVSLFRANMCTAGDVQCSSTTATPKMPDCNAHFRSSNPTSQHLVSPGPLSLSLSLSFHALFSGHPLSGPRFRTSFYGPHYFSTSLQDSFSSGPRF